MELLFDLEGDDLLLNVKNLWCGVFKDIKTKEVYRFTPDNLSELKGFLCNATKLVAHNGIGYDFPVLKKLCFISDYSIKRHILNGKPCKFVDTFVLSSLFNPDRPGGHSLKAWGERLGNYKGDWEDFSQYSPGMLHYCEQDVEVLEGVYYALQEEYKGV